MIAGRPAATIALYHRRQVQSVDHLDDKPREMPLGKPFIERRRKQKPRTAVKLPEIAHQAHPAGESIAPSYPLRHVICQFRQAVRGRSTRCDEASPVEMPKWAVLICTSVAKSASAKGRHAD